MSLSEIALMPKDTKCNGNHRLGTDKTLLSRVFT